MSLVICSEGIADSYSRSDWRHWSDYDRDCQNTRQELLIETSLIEPEFTHRNKCTVKTGLWFGAYTGEAFAVARDVDIDHVIPLKWASDHGGLAWSPLLKKVFANDPDNLIVTGASANRRKGARGPSEYMPREKSRCEYVRRWTFLLSKYELKAGSKDAKIISRTRKACNDL